MLHFKHLLRELMKLKAKLTSNEEFTTIHPETSPKQRIPNFYTVLPDTTERSSEVVTETSMQTSIETTTAPNVNDKTKGQSIVKPRVRIPHIFSPSVAPESTTKEVIDFNMNGRNEDESTVAPPVAAAIAPRTFKSKEIVQSRSVDPSNEDEVAGRNSLRTTKAPSDRVLDQFVRRKHANMTEDFQLKNMTFDELKLKFPSRFNGQKSQDFDFYDDEAKKEMELYYMYDIYQYYYSDDPNNTLWEAGGHPTETVLVSTIEPESTTWNGLETTTNHRYTTTMREDLQQGDMSPANLHLDTTAMLKDILTTTTARVEESYEDSTLSLMKAENLVTEKVLEDSSQLKTFPPENLNGGELSTTDLTTTSISFNGRNDVSTDKSTTFFETLATSEITTFEPFPVFSTKLPTTFVESTTMSDSFTQSMEGEYLSIPSENNESAFMSILQNRFNGEFSLKSTDNYETTTDTTAPTSFTGETSATLNPTDPTSFESVMFKTVTDAFLQSVEDETSSAALENIESTSSSFLNRFVGEFSTTEFSIPTYTTAVTILAGEITSTPNPIETTDFRSSIFESTSSSINDFSTTYGTTEADTDHSTSLLTSESDSTIETTTVETTTFEPTEATIGLDFSTESTTLPHETTTLRSVTMDSTTEEFSSTAAETTSGESIVGFDAITTETTFGTVSTTSEVDSTTNEIATLEIIGLEETSIGNDVSTTTDYISTQSLLKTVSITGEIDTTSDFSTVESTSQLMDSFTETSTLLALELDSTTALSVESDSEFETTIEEKMTTTKSAELTTDSTFLQVDGTGTTTDTPDTTTNPPLKFTGTVSPVISTQPPDSASVAVQTRSDDDLLDYRLLHPKTDDIEYYYVEEEYEVDEDPNLQPQPVHKQKRDNSFEYYVESISASREFRMNRA